MPRKSKKQQELDELAPVVERPKSKRGRPETQLPHLDAFVASWPDVKVGENRIVPGTKNMVLHADLTLARYHLRKRMDAAGIDKSSYETWAASPGLGITKLA